MSLQLRTAIQQGLRRTVTRNGLVLFAAFLLASALQSGFVQLVTATYLPVNPSVPPTTEVATPAGSQMPELIAAPAGLLAALTGGLVTIPIRIVAIRTMVSDETERIPEEYVFHRLGWATVYTFLSSWVVAFAILLTLLAGVVAAFLGTVGVGALAGGLTTPPQSLFGRILVGATLVVLFLPSVFVGVGLQFTGQEVAVRDKGVLGAITGSWRLVREVRIRLALLALVPVAIQLPLSYLTFETLPQHLANVIQLTASTVLSFVILVIMARIYRQLLLSSDKVDIDADGHAMA
jgi:hypothetical protein